MSAMVTGVDRPSTAETPRVLIVDDDPRNLDALEVMLEPLGCVLVRAHSGDEALVSLLRDDFAAIVLDIKMPGMSGIELATLIKQRRKSRHIPILFLTAHMVDEEEILQGYGVGGVDYLSKPINSDILRSKVGVFIELFRKTRALAHVNDVLEREIADRKTAQEALKRANEELERRVQERTLELNRAHMGVKENEERLRMAMEVARIGAWEWYVASGQRTWSTDPEGLFGFPRGAFGSELQPIRMAYPADRARVDEAVAAALKTGTYETEFRSARPDGSLVWFTERGHVVFDANERPERIIGISRDVTSVREAEQQRERLLRDAREARDEAQAASRAKDEFLAMLSHELRNPLNVIAGGISTLDRTAKPDDPGARTRALVARQVRHLTVLMDDLLDIARLTGGKIVLNRRPVDLGAIVERCIATLNDSNRLSHHVCRKALESVWVDGDESRIEQIIMNVVGNALKFTPMGGEINIDVSSEGPSAVLRVADTGIGITPDVLPRIFDLFVQGDRSIDRTSGGLGVGLALVRRLTELHGGTVTAASAGVGRGAIFTILLPRVPAVPTPIEKETIREAISHPRRILVVEDNRDGREMLRTMLELQGHEVHEAADGVSAVELVKAMQPEVAVVDIGLPGVDGYTVAQRIRATESGERRMRLIALTGYGSETDRRRAADAGFDAHLTKPVDPQRLAQLLASDDCPPGARC